MITIVVSNNKLLNKNLTLIKIMKILLIEDDQDIASHLISGLRSEYINVDYAEDGGLGLKMANSHAYDIIICDLILPDKNADEITQNLRSAGKSTPIIVLSAVPDAETKIKLLSLGVDDYVTKPFNFQELLARIRTILRKYKINSDTVLNCENLHFDLKKHIVTRDGQKIILRHKELQILEYLLRHAGQVLTREMILDYVWGPSIERYTNVVDVHVHHLRKKIDHPFENKLIKTVSNLGYKLSN